MKRIAQTFENLSNEGKTAFIPFSVAGFPDVNASLEIFLKLAEAGNIVEFGFPFSDPTADGPVIQQAAHNAIRNGMNMDAAFEMIRKIRTRTDTPIIFFSYFNPIHKYGPARFAATAAECGVDGVLVVDLPMEESRFLKPQTDAAGIAWINLATPTTPEVRIQDMNRDGSGFLYYVSRTGVTGANGGLPADLAQQCSKLRVLSELPVAVGFGIATPEDAANLRGHADGVVVGSAIVSHVATKGIGTELDAWLKTMAGSLA